MSSPKITVNIISKGSVILKFDRKDVKNVPVTVPPGFRTARRIVSWAAQEAVPMVNTGKEQITHKSPTRSTPHKVFMNRANFVSGEKREFAILPAHPIIHNNRLRLPNLYNNLDIIAGMKILINHLIVFLRKSCISNIN